MPKENLLLRALPDDVYQRLLPDLKRVSIERGHVLHRPGETIEVLHFPLDCVISVTITMADGKTAETGVIGNREVAGINAFMGGRETTQTEYIAELPGEALKIRSAPLREEFNRNSEMRDVMLKYTQAFVAQISQNAACNRLHEARSRYARWMLEACDRVESDDIQLTQEFIGQMLGVRRASVNQIGSEFEKAGVIHTSRGRTCILDRATLEAASCECYSVLKEEYDRLLGRR